MTDGPTITRRKDLRRRLDKAAASFDDADYVHRRCFEALIERMAPLVIEPTSILDLGSATGTGSRELGRRFRRARVVSVDLSAGMLRRARGERSRFSRIREVQADAMQLPFLDGTFDLLFANLLLPWITDLPGCLAEVNRVLRTGGLFLFSTLGAGSLASLREAWAAIDPDAHVTEFADMHDVGDALMGAGLSDPVLDVDPLTVTFASAGRLYGDLSACGARNSLVGRRRSLTGTGRWRQFEALLDEGSDSGRLAVQLELVYGHAWGSGRRPPGGEFHVEPATIGRRRRLR
jgi:malonyl-CoA O-methyltransferase